jgi:hypothetical protein
LKPQNIEKKKKKKNHAHIPCFSLGPTN